MKNLKQILVQLKEHVLVDGGTEADDGLAARLHNNSKSGAVHDLCIIASWGKGWDHVSVSLPHRVPTWAEMCFAKDFFFHPAECVVQYHPPEEQYINDHENVLHLWRPQNEQVPMPPLTFV